MQKQLEKKVGEPDADLPPADDAEALARATRAKKLLSELQAPPTVKLVKEHGYWCCGEWHPEGGYDVQYSDGSTKRMLHVPAGYTGEVSRIE